MAAVLLSVGLLAALAWACMRSAGGSLFYSLDDPYIHLALARNIQQGSYGINPGEWASPSSSILWPFLLALIPARWAELGPLLINGLCCALSVLVLHALLRATTLPAWARVPGAVGLGLGLNLFGVAFTGMEHSLQVALTLFVAWRLQQGRRDAWLYAALAVMPWVRYECLAISLPVAAWLFWTGDRLRACLAVAVSMGAMAAFSFVLHGQGLPWLPSSVMAKAAEQSALDNVMAQPMLVVLIAWLGYVHARQGLWLRYGLTVLAPGVGFLLFGRVGWFGRYEVFMAAWLVALTLPTASYLTRDGKSAGEADAGDRAASTDDMSARPEAPSTWRQALVPALMCLAIALSFPNLWRYTLLTPWATRNVADQQAVTAWIARELDRPVAVNDLGLVALRSDRYVLDLWGLGSAEALDARLSGEWSAVWLESLMARKGVEYAFIYREWFPPLPSYWVKVGELLLPDPQVSAARGKVTLMARSPQAAVPLRAVLTRLKSSDARLGAIIELAPEDGASPYMAR